MHNQNQHTNNHAYNGRNAGWDTLYQTHNQQQVPIQQQQVPIQQQQVPVQQQQVPVQQQQVPVQQQEYNSFHVYGGAGALTFQFGEFKGKPSINIDGARSLNKNTYDWKNKTTLLLNDNEVPHVLAVLLGKLQKYEGRFHGDAKDKWFNMENQKEHGKKGTIFFQIGQGKGNSVSVPISPEDSFYVAAYILNQLGKRFPYLDAGFIPNLITATTLRLTF